jgi:hypothetical protein
MGCWEISSWYALKGRVLEEATKKLPQVTTLWVLWVQKTIDDGFVIVCTYAKEKLWSGCKTLELEDGLDWKTSNLECTLSLFVFVIKVSL